MLITSPNSVASRITFRNRLIVVLLGALLLSAAGLKIHALAVDPLSQDGFVSSSWLHLLIIELELLIGLWLISGVAMSVAWLIALMMFTLLTLVSLYQALTGQASCGCFGKIQVNPWITFVFDAIAVLALMVFNPRGHATAGDATSTESRLTRILLQTGTLAVVLLSVVGVGFLYVSKDPALDLARIRGETLCVEPSILDVGEAEAGATRLIPVQLHNYGAKAVEVVGGNVSCVCMTLSDVPVTVPAKSSVTVHIEVIYKGTPGRFTHSFKYFHAGKEQSTVGRFTGVVLPTNQGTSLTTASQ